MELEPLPKVTFLPAQLTELVIRNWTGDIIDFEKNGQVRKANSRSAKYITDTVAASFEKATNSRENSNTDYFMARASSNGLMEQSIQASSPRTK